MKLEHTLTPYTKISSKWLKDFNMRHDMTKLLEENIGKAFSEHQGNVFLGLSPKPTEIKAKLKKWNRVKLISCAQQRKSQTKQKQNIQIERKSL